MKKIVLLIAFGFSLLAVMSFSSKKIIDSPKIVLKEEDVVVEHNVITEQTQLIQGLRDEVDELYDTTYKLNKHRTKSHKKSGHSPRRKWLPSHSFARTLINF